MILLEPFSRNSPKPSVAVKSSVFPYNLRPEVDNDVISSMAIGNVGVDVSIKFGDSRSNGPMARSATAFRLKITLNKKSPQIVGISPPMCSQIF